MNVYQMCNFSLYCYKISSEHVWYISRGDLRRNISWSSHKLLLLIYESDYFLSDFIGPQVEALRSTLYKTLFLKPGCNQDFLSNHTVTTVSAVHICVHSYCPRFSYILVKNRAAIAIFPINRTDTTAYPDGPYYKSMGSVRHWQCPPCNGSVTAFGFHDKWSHNINVNGPLVIILLDSLSIYCPPIMVCQCQ